MAILETIGNALALAAIMGWDIFWGINLGFLLSAAIDAAVSKNQMGKLMPDARIKSIGIATVLGAASSSCSYAAVAISRSIFRKGGDFTSAMVFQFASTNLVIELGILLAALIGWQFTLAEFFGGLLMIALIAFFFRLFLKQQLVDDARQRAVQNLKGTMEGHVAMATAEKSGSFLSRIFSKEGFTAISHYFVMNWQMLWKDIAGGLLIAGALGAFVPKSYWSSFFLSGQGIYSTLWGVIIGPVVAVFSFVCSIGNVPLALILWNGGIGFGGVVSFIFADLIILPILDIYRRYYGWKMMWFLLFVFYISMVLAAFATDLTFTAANLIPPRGVSSLTLEVKLNYTTILNIIFGVIAAILTIRFFKPIPG